MMEQLLSRGGWILCADRGVVETGGFIADGAIVM